MLSSPCSSQVRTAQPSPRAVESGPELAALADKQTIERPGAETQVRQPKKIYNA
ncbi:hypothetical protein L209DRAFT_747043 [Thermothelomyces heterothallicus CBS 203.75]